MEKIVYNVIFRSNILVRLVVPTVNIGATKSHQSHLCLRPCNELKWSFNKIVYWSTGAVAVIIKTTKKQQLCLSNTDWCSCSCNKTTIKEQLPLQINFPIRTIKVLSVFSLHLN